MERNTVTSKQWVALFAFTFVISLIAGVAIVYEAWGLVITIIVALVAAAFAFWWQQRQTARRSAILLH